MELTSLPIEICTHIASYVIEPKYKLLDWIDKSKLSNYGLSMNKRSIQFLKENPDKIHWSGLSANPNAIDLLKDNLDKINWSALSYNPNAINLLEANVNKINWYCLSDNPNIFEIDRKLLNKEIDSLANTLFNVFGNK